MVFYTLGAMAIDGPCIPIQSQFVGRISKSVIDMLTKVWCSSYISPFLQYSHSYDGHLYSSLNV